jgi:hypothetical protein
LAEWKHVDERLQKLLSNWKHKFLSPGGRLVLINLVLTDMILYMISFFQITKGVLHRLRIICDQGFFLARGYREKEIPAN